MDFSRVAGSCVRFAAVVTQRRRAEDAGGMLADLKKLFPHPVLLFSKMKCCVPTQQLVAGGTFL
jgi:hypothetical protein